MASRIGDQKGKEPDGLSGRKAFDASLTAAHAQGAEENSLPLLGMRLHESGVSVKAGVSGREHGRLE